MAHFKVSAKGPDIGQFDLPLGRTMKLIQWGGDASNNPLELALNRTEPSVELNVLPDKLAKASTAFTLKGSSAGVAVGVAAYVRGSGRTARYAEDLKVNVRGTPTKQPGYTADMLADIAANGSSDQVYLYSRVMQDPSDSTHVLSQDTRPGHFNCGDVAAAYGPKLFSKDASTAYFVYYLPPKTSKMADLRFNATRLGHGIAKIKTLVSQGTPVRVWLIHHDGFSIPVIQGDWRTHFLTIIGYSGNKFLYLDPWPNGSKLDYDGGMYSKRRIAFMGELTFDPAHLELGLASPSGFMGAHDYKVIAGP